MFLDYGTQVSPTPISLSIGTIKKPKLIDISEITFERFNLYEIFLKMTPEVFYTKIEKDLAEQYWNSLSEEEKNNVTLYDIILQNDKAREVYIEIFNFFFTESIIFKEGLFILLNENVKQESIQKENIRGVIHENTFPEILTILQQICCIYNKEERIDNLPFKNKIAKELYEKMLKAQKKEKEEKKASNDLTIPNIISSVCVKHPSLNYSNIWEITIFQLLDTFNKLQVNSVHEIDSIRVAVWGDEKKIYDAALWYKNQYDT